MAQTDPLQAHRWKHRLLLVFTPSDTADAARQLHAALELAACEINDRDMLVAWLSAADGNRLGDEAIPNELVGQWRSRLGIDAREFGVVLVGKDGGVKARYDALPVLTDILALIDAMPMRRAEMRSGSGGCSG
jgi:hypothetical protein